MRRRVWPERARRTAAIAVAVAVLSGACGGGSGGGAGPAATAPPAGKAVLHVLDPASGARRWSATLPGGWSTVPVMVGSGIYVQVADDCRNGRDTTLVALDAGTGEVRWTAPSATGCDWGETAPLVTSSGAVVVGARLRGLDIATGEERWSIPVEAGVRPVAVGDVLLLVPDGTGTSRRPDVRRLDAATGEVMWGSTDLTVGGLLGAGGGLVASLTIAPGPLVQVRVVGADDGETRWTAELPFHERITPPAVGPREVVVSVSNGVGEPVAEGAGKGGASIVATVAAFAAVGGEERWRHEYRPASPGEAAGAGFVTPVAVALDADRAYELRPGVLEAFDAGTGASRWAAEVTWKGDGAGTVVLSGAQVVATNDDGLLARDAATGAERWSSELAVPTWRARLRATGAAVMLVEWGRFTEPAGD